MSWLGSIVVAVVVAACSALAAGLMADRAVGWLRVSQVEGNAGFMALGLGLLGLVGGFVIALLVSRHLGVPGIAGFVKSAGLALAICLGVIGIGGGLAWLNRDEDIALNGRQLALAFEIRLGPGITLAGTDPYQLYAYLDAEGATAQSASLDFAEGRQAAGGAAIAGRVKLHTKRPGPYIAVGGHRFDGKVLQFDTPLPAMSDPTAEHWTAWRGPRPSDATAASAGLAGTTLRYRVTWAD